MHLSKPVPYIVKVVAFVYVSSLPSKHTIPTFLIVRILALVFICFARSTFPYAIAVSQPIFEVSLKEATVDPVILTKSRWLSVFI